MGRALCAALVALALAGSPALAQQPRHGLWIGFGLGGGGLTRWSDQDARSTAGTLTGSLQGGVVLAPWLRVGLEANGWLLSASDLNDPTKGATVNELLAIARAYPWPSRGLFLKAGYGWASYGTNAAAGLGSSSFGAWLAGAGYELPVARNVSLTFAADWTRSPLGSVTDGVYTATGRRLQGWDLIVGAQYH
ncbi:MAG TPA: outer membrane beta-barrel protein [Gemmatimonadales bacterium]|nr:outer membrane beta-barrel protein [Gemmatimonadales bacterium]